MQPLLSLAIITGPVGPELIERFIRSFDPLSDEFIIVGAGGARNTDETVSHACTVCQELGKRFIAGAYQNRPEFSEWEHVDDFAAARNTAFDLATGKWIMWADTDDLITNLHALFLRGLLQRPEMDQYDMIKMPYLVPSEQITRNMRERVIRRGVARWNYRIHENLEPTGGAKLFAAQVQDAHILHAPASNREPNSARNLRILRSIPEAELSTSHRFYLFQEELAAGNEAAAIPMAQKFLDLPDAGPAEKYEILLHLARTVKEDPKSRMAFLMTALGIDPSRREAIGELAMLELQHGKPWRAEAFLSQMESLPMPKPPPWNVRDSFWGWQGLYLRTAFYRRTNRQAKADVLELNHFLKHGALISLLHATRGRPQQAAEARSRWLMAAANPDAIEHIFAIDLDDEASDPLCTYRHIAIPGGLGPCAAWNAALAVSHGKVVIQMSDDWNPPLHWDRLILSRLRSGVGQTDDLSQPAVLAVSDGTRKDGLICMAICTRVALKAVDATIYTVPRGNWLFHPTFFSMFSDNWFTVEMRERGIVIDAPEIVFEHLHPAFGKGEMDETYARSNHLLHYATGYAALKQLQKFQQPFTWRDVKGWDDGSPAQLHAKIMQQLPSGSVVFEIGSAYGRGLCAMGAIADWLRDQNQIKLSVIGIDTFEGTPGESPDNYAADMEAQCKAAILNTGCRSVGFCRARSTDFHIGNQQISYVFIDAAHDYESVKADLEAWVPRIGPGGFIAGHDYFDAPGVKQAVDERFGDQVQTLGQCWYVQLP
jgi:hypothetical protein